MSNRADLLAANDRYAATFGHGDLPAPPARRIAILTCMDARLDPAKFLGLNEGDAHVIRNAGGRADQSALQSLVISQQLLGTTEIIVIHHTQCGMLNLSNEAMHDLLTDRFGAPEELIDFGGFDDLEQSVRDDIETIRAYPLIPDDIAISGFIYDVATGRLAAVD